MNFVSALFAVVAFVAELFSIYNFIASRTGTKTRTYSILGMVGAGILLGALLLGNLPATLGAYGSRNTTTPTSDTQPHGTGITPTPTPSPTPSPRPTSPPCCGTLLYQADQSWSGWSGTKEWNVLNGMLTNDGTGYPGQPTILAPDVLQVSDYAV